MTTEKRRECEGCSRETGPGLVAFTDELGPDWLALCVECLETIKPKLAAYLRIATCRLTIAQVRERHDLP